MDAEQVIDLTEDTQVMPLYSGVIVKEDNCSQDENNVEEQFIIVKNPEFEEGNYQDEGNSLEQEILPPPLTLDDPAPSKNIKRRKSRKQDSDSNSSIVGIHTAPTQRFQRSCKDKIIDYSDFMSGININTLEEIHQPVPIKSQSCDLCGASFEKESGLKRHKIMKHKTLSTSSGIAQNEKSTSEKSSTTSKQSSSKDIKLEPGINPPTNPEEIQNSVSGSDKSTGENSKPKLGPVKNSGVKKSYPCPECGKIFSLSCNLSRHLRIHRGTAARYQCAQCEKMFTSKQGLRGHVGFIHTGERPYKCSLCSKAFVTNSDLNRHQSKHSDIRKYKCKDCGRGFKQRSALIQHIQRKLKQKTWHCELCPKRFTTKTGLKCHMVVHTKIKLYECESCQRQFSHRVSLEAHVRVHTGVMPYMCSVCGKKFAHLSNRNRHMRQMHQ